MNQIYDIINTLFCLDNVSGYKHVKPKNLQAFLFCGNNRFNRVCILTNKLCKFDILTDIKQT